MVAVIIFILLADGILFLAASQLERNLNRLQSFITLSSVLLFGLFVGWIVSVRFYVG